MTMATYYEEIPMDMILATIKELENRLRAEELKLAVECATQLPAYVTLNLKNGEKLYVARAEKWNGKTQKYEYTVQLLDDDTNVLLSTHYTEEGGQHFNDNHYPVEPLFMIAVKIIRRNKYNTAEVKPVLAD